jgi:hypothetical protein
MGDVNSNKVPRKLSVRFFEKKVSLEIIAVNIIKDKVIKLEQNGFIGYRRIGRGREIDTGRIAEKLPERKRNAL